MTSFGFHVSVGGNRTGIGNHFQVLDAAGIPIALVSIGDYGAVHEVVLLMRASNVPHVLIYRVTDLDVPNYGLDMPGLFPCFAVYKAIYGRPGAAVNLCQLVFGIISSGVKTANLSNLSIGKRYLEVFLAANPLMLIDTQDINAVPHVRRSRQVFKVIKAVICLVTVPVINLSPWRTWPKKGAGNQYVDKEQFSPPVLAEIDGRISKPGRAWLEYLANVRSRPRPYPHYPAVIANSVPSLITNHVSPFLFHLIPSIKTSLAVAQSTTKELARDVLKTSIGLFRLNNKLFRGKEYFTTGGTQWQN